MNEQNNSNYEIKLECKNEFSFSKHVLDLINAILNVNEEYLTYLQEGYNVDTKDKYNIEQIERIFAYELYHQWSLLKDAGLILNGEPGKCINNSYKYPDLILHGGQGDWEHNEIAVEIKRAKEAIKNNGENIINDFEKLSNFLEERGYDIDSASDSAKNEAKWKNYKNAVFILYGENMGKISEALKFSEQTKTKKYKKINSDIICITYNYDSDNNKYTLEIARISDLKTGE